VGKERKGRPKGNRREKGREWTPYIFGWTPTGELVPKPLHYSPQMKISVTATSRT